VFGGSVTRGRYGGELRPGPTGLTKTCGKGTSRCKKGLLNQEGGRGRGGRDLWDTIGGRKSHEVNDRRGIPSLWEAKRKDDLRKLNGKKNGEKEKGGGTRWPTRLTTRGSFQNYNGARGRDGGYGCRVVSGGGRVPTGLSDKRKKKFKGDEAVAYVINTGGEVAMGPQLGLVNSEPLWLIHVSKRKKPKSGKGEGGQFRSFLKPGKGLLRFFGTTIREMGRKPPQTADGVK